MVTVQKYGGSSLATAERMAAAARRAVAAAGDAHVIVVVSAQGDTTDEMIARAGAQVLHDRSVELGMRFDVPIWVKSSFRDGGGTVVSD